MSIIQETAALAQTAQQAVLEAKIVELGIDRNTTFEGQPEAGLMHYLGAAAFDGSNFRPFGRFIQSVETAMIMDERLPILFVNHIEAEVGQPPMKGERQTSLSMLEPSQLIVIAAVKRLEAVLTDSNGERNNVTERSLGLRAVTATLPADIAKPQLKTETELPARVIVSNTLLLGTSKAKDLQPKAPAHQGKVDENSAVFWDTRFDRLKATEGTGTVAAIGWSAIRNQLYDWRSRDSTVADTQADQTTADLPPRYITHLAALAGALDLSSDELSQLQAAQTYPLRHEQIRQKSEAQS